MAGFQGRASVDSLLTRSLSNQEFQGKLVIETGDAGGASSKAKHSWRCCPTSSPATSPRGLEDDAAFGAVASLRLGLSFSRTQREEGRLECWQNSSILVAIRCPFAFDDAVQVEDP